MSEAHKSHKKEYFIVFFVLFVLTVLELWVPEWDTTKTLKTSMLIFLACVKAWFVAYFFMHLKEETKYLKYIAAIPISAALYTIMVALETYYR